MFRDELKGTDFSSRTSDLKEIHEFVDKVFGSKEFLTFADYDSINKIESSEMLVSFMYVFHNNLPCSENYFRLKENYRKVSASKIQRRNSGGTPKNISVIAPPRTMNRFTG